MMTLDEINQRITDVENRVNIKKEELSALQVTLNDLYLHRLQAEVENDISMRLRETVSGWDDND